jgi:hypothetical protein
MQGAGDRSVKREGAKTRRQPRAKRRKEQKQFLFTTLRLCLLGPHLFASSRSGGVVLAYVASWLPAPVYLLPQNVIQYTKHRPVVGETPMS